jgi:EmrB/QacA subfamily drug resistance transporter
MQQRASSLLPPQRWMTLAAVVLGVFMSTIDASIVNIALPTLTHAFGTDFAAVQWVVLSYMLVNVTLIPVVGRLADMLGKRRLYIAGFATFTAASLACGVSGSLPALLAARLAQGVGAALLHAIGPALITEAFPPGERGRALGVTGAAVSLGIVMGPSLGGVLLSIAPWQGIFLVNVPIGLWGGWMAWRHVHSHAKSGGGAFDFAGAALLGTALVTFLLALTQGQRMGFTDRRSLALMAVAAVAAPAFVLVELRRREPMLDLRLFRDRAFAAHLASSFLCFTAMSGTLLLMPFYLQHVLGYSTQQAGLLLGITPVVMGILAPFAGALSDRLGSAVITRTGLALLCVGLLTVTTLGEGTTTAGYLARFALVGLGVGLFQSPNNSAIMGHAPRDRLGVASGLLAVARTLGQVTGVGLLGAIWGWRVAVRAGGAVEGGATQAAPALQVSALNDACRAGLVLVAVAFFLHWRLKRQRT